MDKDTWKKISRIFDIALALPPERRKVYIRNFCSNDPDLLQEVQGLLDHVEESGLLEEQLLKNKELLDTLFQHLEAGVTSSDLEGTLIGNWKALELLGQGGMGEVYKVERSDSDIYQQGALKIMRRGLNDEENLRRFRLEKQILAGLQHPNIARLIDGGVSRDGRPYLVMEYVEGVPIDTYCNRQELNLRERLKLFALVCETVQHAHKNLIVHRDLKPENILVTKEGRIKILDFGIAKLLDREMYPISATETRHFRRVMSLQYAAPEQVSGKSINTSTDVYALGNLLYELLTALSPFDFNEKNYSEIEQIILHEDPPAPSRRLKTQAASEKNDLPKTASKALKQIAIAPQLKGDLDAIVLKALRKESDARYQSASRLREDVINYLQDKTVGARNGTINYRMKKFIRRYRWGVAAAAITLFSLVGGIAIAYWQARVAGMERDQARLEKNKAEEVTRFLTSLFEANHPDQVRGDMPTARDLLDAGVQRIDDSFENNPELRSELQAMLGKLYIIIDEHERALPLLKEGIRLAKRNNDLDTQTEALRMLGLLYSKASEYEAALTTFQEATDLLRQNGQVPGLKHAALINEIRSILTGLNREEEALKLTAEALESARNANKLSIESRYRYLQAYGTQLRYNLEFTKAMAIFEEALELDFPPDRLPRRRFEIHQAQLFVAYYSGNQEMAFALHDTLLQEIDELFPEVHGARTHLIDIISRSLIRFEKMNKAERLMREGLELQKEVYPDQNRYYLGWSHARLGMLLRKKGVYSQALQHIRQARAIFSNLYGPDYHLYGRMTAEMGDLYRRMGDYRKSEELLSEALLNSKTYLENNPSSYHIVQIACARLRLAQKQPLKALEHLENTLIDIPDSWKTDGRLHQEILSLKGEVHEKLGNIPEAEKYYKQAVDMGDQISLFRGIAWPRLLTGYARFLVDHSLKGVQSTLKRALRANHKLYGDTHPVTKHTKKLITLTSIR